MWIRQRFEPALREDLLPRRICTGFWPSAYPINRKWISEGQVTGKDCHTWLRTTQLRGRDLCIIGCSLDACRVCAEAWHSGFKPVLVLLEDSIAEGAKSAVVRTANELGTGYFRGGLLQCGYQVIVTHSSQVTLDLDSEGQPADVTVALPGHPISFRGPVIVLGQVLRPEMARTFNVHAWEVHLERVARECATVTDPQFWEERYDPECLPCVTPTYSTFLVVCLVWGVLSMSYYIPYIWQKDTSFGILRSIASLPNTLVTSPSIIITTSQMLGVQTPTMLFSKYSLVIGFLFFLLPFHTILSLRISGDLLSEYLAATVACIWLSHFLVAYALLVAKLRINRWSLLWFITSCSCIVGTWASSVPILVLYQYLLTVNGTVAALYLPMAVSLVESFLVRLVHVVYKRAVSARRRGDPDCVAGDQKWSYSVALASTHACAEMARLTTLLCGAIQKQDVGFLWLVAASLGSSLVLNTMSRTAVLARILMRLPKLGNCFCPTASWAAHANARFAMGYGRFMVTFSFMLGRGMIHGQWETSMLVQDGVYGTWCWSGVALITVCMALFTEVLEDLTVYRITAARFSVPRLQTYTDVMQARLQDPKIDGRHDIEHYFIPDLDFEEGQTPGFVLAPTVRTVRVMDAPILHTIVGACFIQFTTLLAVGVGSGNLLGYCRPLTDKDSFALHMQGAILWSIECDF